MFSTHRPLIQLLCWLLAVTTPLSPSMQLLAQTVEPAAAGFDSQFILPYSAGVVSARPMQILTSEITQLYPIEVVQAACLKELGFDPLNVERVVFSMIPPLTGPPSYAIRVDCLQRIDLANLAPRLIRHTAPGERNGQAYLQSHDPKLPSLIWASERTLLVAPEHTLDQLLSTKPIEPDAFTKQLAACDGDDLALLLNLTVLGPLLQLGLNEASKEIPPEFHEYLVIPSLLNEIRLRVNTTGRGPMELSTVARDSNAADRVEELVDQLLSMARRKANQQAAELLQKEDPVEQAMGRYIMRVSPVFSEQLAPQRNGERFTIFEVANNGSPTSQLTSIAMIGTLVGLLLPAVQAAREAARRNASINNMKQLLLSLLIFEEQNKRFPAYASFDENGKPLLSWRVHILPHMEEQALYEQFHLDEPWDSEHNRQLISLMPDVYIDPSSPKYSNEDGHTHYLAVKGKGYAFDGTERGRSFASFRDGTSNSIMIVQCNDEAAVPWTKPQDFEPNQQALLTGLAKGFHPGGFLAGFADGHVTFISNDIDTEVFGNLLTIAGGELSLLE